jgi:hypothetical protein
MAYKLAGEKTQVYGDPQYNQALADYKKNYGTYSQLMSQAAPQLQAMTDYYKPGGGYGEGQRQEAKETVQGGVNKDLSQMVASGMSSQAGSKGLETLAGTELGKMYKNIEDTRNQLWQQSITPYAQMMTSLAQMQQARPNYSQYVRPVTTGVYAQTSQQQPDLMAQFEKDNANFGK